MRHGQPLLSIVVNAAPHTSKRECAGACGVRRCGCSQYRPGQGGVCGGCGHGQMYHPPPAAEQPPTEEEPLTRSMARAVGLVNEARRLPAGAAERQRLRRKALAQMGEVMDCLSALVQDTRRTAAHREWASNELDRAMAAYELAKGQLTSQERPDVEACVKCDERVAPLARHCHNCGSLRLPNAPVHH
jgi:ribosomal protein L40E